MRYFWHFVAVMLFIAFITFLFFAFSLNTRHNITFTDDLPELTEPTITIADPILGENDAAVTIVNFGDYECDSCQTVEGTLTELREEYGDDLRIVWKDMPNTTSHDEALNAAIAARCAGEQKKFFDYHALLFANQHALGEELYLSIATELGLKERAFTSCYENQTTLPLIQKSFNEGIALEVTATPTLFVNGERYTGATSKLELRGAIEAALHAQD